MSETASTFMFEEIFQVVLTPVRFQFRGKKEHSLPNHMNSGWMVQEFKGEQAHATFTSKSHSGWLSGFIPKISIVFIVRSHSNCLIWILLTFPEVSRKLAWSVAPTATNAQKNKENRQEKPSEQTLHSVSLSHLSLMSYRLNLLHKKIQSLTKAKIFIWFWQRKKIKSKVSSIVACGETTHQVWMSWTSVCLTNWNKSRLHFLIEQQISLSTTVMFYRKYCPHGMCT